MDPLRHDECERARLSRDARFDGQFYVGVKTTGIYCRPICPARPPKRGNVTFFPTAAAANEAGFRPCLRCRPECAPGTPAWSGTSTTVRRGLRLIATGALDEDNVEKLADRLGVTSRHLRRLFTKHLGASPLAVARTQRLHFAKRLIDETQLPMNQISNAAGYGSVRRFNDAIKIAYRRAPSDLRKTSGYAGESQLTATISMHLSYRQPFSWTPLLNFFSARALPGVEHIDGDCYRRTISVGNGHGIVAVQPGKGNLRLTLHGVETSHLFDVVQSAREVFDLDAPVAEIASSLRQDKLLAKIIRKEPGIRLPGTWNGFELTVRAILGQQISVQAATTLAGRIVAKYGDRLEPNSEKEHDPLCRVFPTPARLRRARFHGIGLVRSRAETIRGVAGAVESGDLRFDLSQEPAGFCENLKKIRGIGEWTAQYIAMRVLKYPDAFPESDLGLAKAVNREIRMTSKALARRSEAWRPWRAYAAIHLWNSLRSSGG